MTDGGPSIPDLRVKYRPRRFRHLAQGLSHPTVRAITLALRQGRKLQAMLISGPYGAGKTSVARLLGARAACTNQHLHPYEPCGRCEGCLDVITDPHSADWMGYSEWDMQSAAPRDIIHELLRIIPCRKRGGKLMPQRVVALDEFHRLPVRDQEKFVKVIEDYGPRYLALFVICVAEDAVVCPAIAQRCAPRRIAVPSLQASTRHVQAIGRSEGVIINANDAELIAATADCVPRRYLSMLQDVLILTDGGKLARREDVLAVCDTFIPPHAVRKE